MINRYVKPLVNTVKLLNKYPQSAGSINLLFCLKQNSKINTLAFQRNKFCFTQQKSDDPNQVLKNESKQFYQNYVEDIIQLQKSQDWQMLISSTAEPLIIDFYADWCGPCKKLTPILEERVKKMQGKVKLLKVNIDKCGQLAHQLKITSVPTVFAVYRGQGIDSFQGLPENSKIDKMFETLQKVVSLSSKQEKSYQLLSQGKKHLAEGNYQQAEKCFEGLSQKGADEQLIALREVLLAQCYISQQKIAKFKDQIQKMKKYEEYYMTNPELKDFFQLIISEGEKINELSSQIPEVNQLKKTIESQPGDLASHFRLSQVYKENQMMEESLEELITILKANKSWEDKKANKLILSIFKQLGNSSPLTQKYRKIMQRLLN